MAFVTRYQVQDLRGRFWNGEDFTRDEDSAQEYLDENEADAIANSVGGQVQQFERSDRFGDLPPPFRPLPDRSGVTAMEINFIRAKYSAVELLEALTVAQHAEKPLTKAIRIDDAENHFQDLARELGFAVYPLNHKEAAE